MISGGGFQFLIALGTSRDLSDQCDQPDELAKNDPQMAKGCYDAQPHSTAKRAPPVVPFSGHQVRRPSVFMWPIIGSMALRR
jgi:hypothetical protein